MSQVTFKQIILITDGCSNVGFDPEAAASIIRQHGIVVNVIGVLDSSSSMGRRGRTEVERIARAGGGLSETVYAQELAKTMQTVTRQAITKTVRGAVNAELRSLLGKNSLAELEPEKRSEVVRAMDEMCETGNFRAVLLIDTSASMRSKIPAVRDAVKDFALSLSSRSGAGEVCCLTFPDGDRTVNLCVDWTDRIDDVERVGQALQMSGTTPTGPALLEAMKPFGIARDIPRSTDHETKGDLDEYVF